MSLQAAAIPQSACSCVVQAEDQVMQILPPKLIFCFACGVYHIFSSLQGSVNHTTGGFIVAPTTTMTNLTIMRRGLFQEILMSSVFHSCSGLEAHPCHCALKEPRECHKNLVICQFDETECSPARTSELTDVS